MERYASCTTRNSLMRTTMGERDLAASKAPQSAQEGRLGRAVTMATYLRSALGRAGEKIAVGATTHVADEERYDDGDERGRENQRHECGERCGNVAKTSDDMEGVGSETASSSGRTEEILERQDEDAKENATETFTLKMDVPSTDVVREESVQDIEARERVLWAYCDVLLQPDEHGLGLNLSVAAEPEGFPVASTVGTRTVVTISSFRRLHVDDTGPAEASGQVLVGDILHSIDGCEVRTLEAVANKLWLVMGGDSRPFILLRFLRPSGESKPSTVVAGVPVENADADRSSSPDDLWTTRPDVAMLIRELVVKNQSLEEQVLASRLKQDEQRIQLEQLHTLYAKTQLENWSGFSLPKATAMRAPFSVRRASESLSKPNNSFSTAAARLIGAVNPAQYDVEFAVNAERERLTRHFEQRLEMERRQLQDDHEAAVQAIQVAADKKIRMLEFGIKTLLQTQPAETASAEPSAHVQILRHQLLHRKHESAEHSGTNPKHDCVLCLLTSAENRTNIETATSADHADALRTQMLQLLEEYRAFQATRKAELAEHEYSIQPHTTSNQEEEDLANTDPTNSSP